MKKLLLTATLSCAVVLGFSQYYYVSSINAGTNPGGLNNDPEESLAYQTGQGTGWAEVLNTQPGAVWSTAKTIPFTFNFNGTNYTQFKASSTGVLTFTSSPGAAPSSVNAALPSALVPDNSICAWGLDISGAGGNANDAVMSKTFGSAPNRQFWVTWASATDPTQTGNQYLYWSIVFEETSNKIYLVDQRTYVGANNVSMTLGVQINAGTAFQVSGSPNVTSYTTGTAGSANTPSDNTYYTFIQGAQPANDAAMTAVTPMGMDAFVQAGSTIYIGGTILNLGSAPITSVDLKYSNGAGTFTDSRSGLNIGSGSTYNFQHASSMVAQAGATNIDLWVELVGDADAGNDHIATTITAYTALPNHNVVVEEKTGTWCGWCPRGTVWMDNMSQSHPDAILIAVHNGDPMANAVHDAGMNSFSGGYPTIVVDRKSVMDPKDIVAGYNNHRSDFAFAEVGLNATYNAGTRQCNVVASAKPVIPLSGNYRLAVVFTEDGVTGTTSGYNQVNYYSYQSQNLPLEGAGKNWQQEPSSVPASSMVYDFVARTILNSFTGQALPSSMNGGQEYTLNFNYTVPAGYNEAKMRVIVLFINGSTGEILNAVKLEGLQGTAATGTQVGIANISPEPVAALNLFPNPTGDALSIVVNEVDNENVVITLSDMLGRTTTELYTGQVNGTHTLVSDVSHLKAGMYLISVSTKNGVSAKAFVKE